MMSVKASDLCGIQGPSCHFGLGAFVLAAQVSRDHAFSCGSPRYGFRLEAIVSTHQFNSCLICVAKPLLFFQWCVLMNKAFNEMPVFACICSMLLALLLHGFFL